LAPREANGPRYTKSVFPVANILFILIGVRPVLFHQLPESIQEALYKINKTMELLEATQDPKEKDFLQQKLVPLHDELQLLRVQLMPVRVKVPQPKKENQSNIFFSVNSVLRFDPFDFYGAL
jgi:hypothetical protein